MKVSAFALALALTLTLALAALFGAPADALSQASSELCPERYHAQVQGSGVLSLPYCANLPVDRPNPNVRRIGLRAQAGASG